MNTPPTRRLVQAVVLFSCLFGVEGLVSTSSGWAQTDAAAQETLPAARFVPPALVYASVFQHYHGYREEKVASWREANDTVRRIGGWRSYLEEAAPSAQPAIAPPENDGRHPGHGGRP
jgi:hypothetical protein